MLVLTVGAPGDPAPQPVASMTERHPESCAVGYQGSLKGLRSNSKVQALRG